MELSAAFEERVRQMEFGRNHRLSLLHVSPHLFLSFPKRRTLRPPGLTAPAQAENELHAEKFRFLDAKLAVASSSSATPPTSPPAPTSTSPGPASSPWPATSGKQPLPGSLPPTLSTQNP
ncbi:hypothetical protein ABZP36_032324 [Zizania latifolia]